MNNIIPKVTNTQDLNQWNESNVESLNTITNNVNGGGDSTYYR